MLELWQQLTSSTPGLINRRVGVSGGGPNSIATKKLLDPVDDFVHMEYDSAGDICALVDAALASLKKVTLFFAIHFNPRFDVFCFLPSIFCRSSLALVC